MSGTLSYSFGSDDSLPVGGVFFSPCKSSPGDGGQSLGIGSQQQGCAVDCASLSAGGFGSPSISSEPGCCAPVGCNVNGEQSGGHGAIVDTSIAFSPMQSDSSPEASDINGKAGFQHYTSQVESPELDSNVVGSPSKLQMLQSSPVLCIDDSPGFEGVRLGQAATPTTVRKKGGPRFRKLFDDGAGVGESSDSVECGAGGRNDQLGALGSGNMFSVHGTSPWRVRAARIDKTDNQLVILARKLKYQVPRGATVKDLADILDVKWEHYVKPTNSKTHQARPTGEEVHNDVGATGLCGNILPSNKPGEPKYWGNVYNDNYRRVKRRLVGEAKLLEQDADLDSAIREAVVEEAVRGHGEGVRDVVNGMDISAIRQQYGASSGDLGEFSVADVSYLGSMPLGSDYTLPGKGPPDAGTKERIIELRQQHKDKCHGRYLGRLRAMRLMLCRNCNQQRLLPREAAEHYIFQGSLSWCQRCGAWGKNQHGQTWGDFNSMDPRAVPPELQDLTEVEEMLIARVAAIMKVEVLKGGTTAARGHCIAFTQNNQFLVDELPRLPREVSYVFVRRCNGDRTESSKFKVHRARVLGALRWLKQNNPFYKNIRISLERINELPVDGSVEEMMVEGSFVGAEDGAVAEDVGPAPHQNPLDGDDDDGGAIIGEAAPGRAVDATMSALLRSLDMCPPDLRTNFDYLSPSDRLHMAGGGSCAGASGAALFGGDSNGADGVHVSGSGSSPAGVSGLSTHAASEAGADPGQGFGQGCSRHGAEYHFQWQRGKQKVNEWTTGYWTMAFPVLFPYGLADISTGRVDSKVKMADWAQHLLWYRDGRFAAHPYWKFVVMNRIMREQAQGQSSFFVRRKLGASVIPSVGELKRRVLNNDASVLRNCIAYAANVKGTNPYWYDRHRDLDALVKFQVWKGRGLPSFFMTGSCAEFHHMELITHLQEFLRQKCAVDNTEVPDVIHDMTVRQKMVKRYSHIVVRFFMEKTKIWIEEILGPVYGVSTHYIRFEFAKSRGQIHFHLLAWRHDRKPHGFIGKRCMEAGFDRDQWVRDLGDWFSEMGFTCEHPGGSDTEPRGQNPMWATPDGLLDLASGQSNVFPDASAAGRVPTLERDVAAYFGDCSHSADVVNSVMLHVCSGYCLKGLPCECRQGYGLKASMVEKPGSKGKQFYGSKKEHAQFFVSQDKRGYLTGEMPRNHRRIVQHIKGMPELWGANCDQTVILSASHPDFPDPAEAKKCCKYITGYMCKNTDKVEGTVELYKAVLGRRPEEDNDISCLNVCRQMVNASVGQMQISGPCASHFLSKEHLVECNLQFVRVPLGSGREIDVRRRNTESTGDLQEAPAACSNIRDKFALEVSQCVGLRCFGLDGLPVEVQNISLYEWASGPKFGEPIGTRVPVPSGACLSPSWPVNAAYAEAIVRLHSPGFVSGLLGEDEGYTAEEWKQSFIDLLASDRCPVMIRMDMHSQWQKSIGVSRRHDQENPYNSSDEESLDEGGAGCSDEPEFIRAMRAGLGYDVDDEGDDVQFDMGINDGTNWADCQTDVGGATTSLEGAWEWLKEQISVRGSSAGSSCSVTMQELGELKKNQREAVTLVLRKMEELFLCGGELGLIKKVKPLRLIVAGTAGTGKTRVIKIINALAHKMFGDRGVQNVAPSGTAARCMGGRTLHSLVPIPFGKKRFEPMRAPTLKRLGKLQEELDGLVCLCLDERSMVGTVTFGWAEFLIRLGMHQGACPEDVFGGLKIVVMFGDDGQLPPIGESRLFDGKQQGSPAGQNGAMQYGGFDSCVYLEEVVRQEGEECYTCGNAWHQPGHKCTILRDLLIRLRYGTITSDDHRWLAERQLHLKSEAEQSLFYGDNSVWIYAKKEGARLRNIEKLMQLNSRDQDPVKVVRCLADDNGCCMRRDWDKSDDWGQMQRLTYLCCGAMVMLTSNLCVAWGLNNGATGTVRDVIYFGGRQPSEDGRELPDLVLVEFNDYSGPVWDPAHPTIVPIGRWVWTEHCKHKCSRAQIPLRVCWGITVHKSQGMTVGPKSVLKRAVLVLGDSSVEGWAPGSAFVQLSRVVSPACMAIEGGYSDSRLQPKGGKGVSAKIVAAEDCRLRNLSIVTREREVGCGSESEYWRLVNWVLSLGPVSCVPVASESLQPDGGIGPHSQRFRQTTLQFGAE